jgi:protein-S-isoprenylcysteine O-methyltransferase Ste14
MTRTAEAATPALSPARAAIRFSVAIGIPLVLLFGGAGTWDWPAAWIYICLLVSGMSAAVVVFAKFQPGLADERARHWRDTTRVDMVILLVIGLLGPASVQLVCGLDKRFGWSAPVPLAAQAVAAVALAAGIAVTAWAMAVNAFFSAVVRIQSDRGHRVVQSGPYGAIRHPGYAAMLAGTIAAPILLGSMWGLLPAAVVAAAILARTTIEDRVLHARLPGYPEYARRVRYRLLPGCW